MKEKVNYIWEIEDTNRFKGIVLYKYIGDYKIEQYSIEKKRLTENFLSHIYEKKQVLEDKYRFTQLLNLYFKALRYFEIKFNKIEKK